MCLPFYRANTRVRPYGNKNDKENKQKTQHTMKKLALTLFLALALGATAQNNSGLFQRGYVSDEVYYNAGGARDDSPLILPNTHGSDTDTPAVPMGSGIAMLVGLSAAYALGKKRKEK
jgi:hypothetical protein